jgi:hypothetical protein
MITWIKQKPYHIFGVVSGLLYAFSIWFGFSSNDFSYLSLSFLLILPVALGFLSTIFASETEQPVGNAFITPTLTALLVLMFALLLNYEFLFCLIVAAPLFFISSFIGALLAIFALWLRTKVKNIFLGSMILVLISPLMAGMTEKSLTPNRVVRTVHSSVIINATPDIVWDEITIFSEIPADQQRVSLFRLIGLPRPIRAEMDCLEVGCARRGYWEDGLAFDASVVEIEEDRFYRVLLTADTSRVESDTAPLKAIGGSAFNMIDDAYEIETLQDGSVRLHLYSTYSTASHLNFYVTSVLDFVISDIQRYILGWERERAEVTYKNENK